MGSEMCIRDRGLVVGLLMCPGAGAGAHKEPHHQPQGAPTLGAGAHNEEKSNQGNGGAGASTTVVNLDRSSFAADFSEGASFEVVGCALKASSNAMISSSNASRRESDARACSSSASSERWW